MTQAEAFSVGDQARPYDSNALLVIRDIAIHHGGTSYRVEEVPTPGLDAVGTWWIAHDELQPA